MNSVLARWNSLSDEEAVKEIMACCGSRAWASGMASQRPFPDVTTLLATSDKTWSNLTAADWMEAFRSHPRIGESRPAQSASAASQKWSTQEQQKVSAADENLKTRMAEANQEYERRFSHIFIVCATGKAAAEILEMLRRRLRNDDATELREAAEQQRLITNLRLNKWLSA